MPSETVQNENNNWKEYLDAVVREVKFRPDRADIRREYEEHLSDAFDALREDGLSEDDASAAAVSNMGDPVEAGRALNRSHNPMLGWIETILRWILIFVLCSSFPIAYAVIGLGVVDTLGVIRGYSDVEGHGELIRTVVVGRSIDWDGRVLSIDEIRLYEDGALELRYRSRASLLNSGRLGSYDLPVFLYDENGTLRDVSNLSKTSGGLITYHQFLCKAFPPDSKAVQIEYGYAHLYKAHMIRFAVDLTATGKEAAE